MRSGLIRSMGQWLGIAVCFGTLLASAAAQAQQKINEDDTPAAKRLETIAVIPMVFQKGTDGAVKTTKETVSTLLTRSRLEVISDAKVAANWSGSQADSDDEDKTSLPTPAQMLKLGKTLGVDWVMAGRAVWHTKSVWIGFGPKTKSDCTVDMMIVDVSKKEIALEAHKVRMDDTAKEDTLKALGTVFVSGLFTFVSGGPKTPHEQRAGQFAVAKAMEPWLVARNRRVKIEPDSK